MVGANAPVIAAELMGVNPGFHGARAGCSCAGGEAFVVVVVAVMVFATCVEVLVGCCSSSGKEVVSRVFRVFRIFRGGTTQIRAGLARWRASATIAALRCSS